MKEPIPTTTKNTNIYQHIKLYSMVTTLIVIGILAILVIWVISVQRNLISKEELCKNAMSQIGVQMSSRWDALTALADLIKSYDEHEYKSLKDVIAQRTSITGSSSAADANIQETILTDAMRRIAVVVEQYPNLKANEMYVKTMDSVNLYENQVRMSRMVYNDSVTNYNRLIRQIPSNIVASLFGFKSKDYLEENQAKTEMPSMKK